MTYRIGNQDSTCWACVWPCIQVSSRTVWSRTALLVAGICISNRAAQQELSRQLRIRGRQQCILNGEIRIFKTRETNKWR